MKRVKPLLAITFVFMFVSLMATSSLIAGTGSGDTGTMHKDKGAMSGKHMGAHNSMKISNITGATVKNPQGEQLGTVEDLIVDNNGNLRYLVLSHGGLLGVGDKLFAIPWRAVSAGGDEETFLVNIDKERLAKAPSFERNSWPNFSDPDVTTRYYGYYHIDVDK